MVCPGSGACSGCGSYAGMGRLRATSAACRMSAMVRVGVGVKAGRSLGSTGAGESESDMATLVAGSVQEALKM